MKFTRAFPKVSRAQVEQMCGEDFAERAASVLSLLFPELCALSSLSEAYEAFDDDPAPLVKVDDNLFFLELWHGGTGTYTDIPYALLASLPGERKDVTLAGEAETDFLRIVPLIACYFSAYADLIAAGEIDYGDEVNFCVEYGDGSCIAAGHCASCMGLPVGKLICALEDDANADFSDMGVPREKTAGFRAGEEEIADTISYAFDEYGYLLGPQTAAAVAALDEYTDSTDDESVTVVFSTASPQLFASEVLTAIGEKSTGNVRRDCFLLEEVTACEASEALIKLQEKAKLFTDTIKLEALADALRSFAGKTGK